MRKRPKTEKPSSADAVFEVLVAIMIFAFALGAVFDGTGTFVFVFTGEAGVTEELAFAGAAGTIFIGAMLGAGAGAILAGATAGAGIVFAGTEVGDFVATGTAMAAAAACLRAEEPEEKGADEPDDPDDPDDELTTHFADDGVTVIVAAFAPEGAEKPRTDCVAVQVLVKRYVPPMSYARYAASFDVTVRFEPALSTNEKLAASTVIEAIAAFDPDTLMLRPPTERRVSGVRVTSLYAANAMAGESVRARAMETMILFMCCFI
ncbi:hypothetical protein KW799_02825 [Candidatus Parcubacteria bacterium]|nr:hypothetical protein [Candidatus Parcubacteria bacterium]